MSDLVLLASWVVSGFILSTALYYRERDRKLFNEALRQSSQRFAEQAAALRGLCAQEFIDQLFRQATEARDAGHPMMIMWNGSRLNLWPLIDAEETDEMLRRSRPVRIQ